MKEETASIVRVYVDQLARRVDCIATLFEYIVSLMNAGLCA